MSPMYLTSADVMETLRIKRTKLSQLLKSDEFPTPIRIGQAPQGQLRWRRDEIEDWIESKRVKTSTPVKSV